MAVALFALVLSILSWGRSRPAALVVDPQLRVFRVPPGAAQVYYAVGCAFIPMLTLAPSTGPELALCLLVVILVGARLVDAWRGTHLHLRSDGIDERSALRSLFVPWEALAPEHPRRPSIHTQHLKLRYTQRRLVRHRGVGFRKRLFIDTVHPWFIADVVRHYAGHPEHRAAIGTAEEYDRLRTQLAGETEPAYPDDNP